MMDLEAGSSSSRPGMGSSEGMRGRGGFMATGGGGGLFPLTTSLLMVLLEWES